MRKELHRAAWLYYANISVYPACGFLEFARSRCTKYLFWESI